MNFSTLTPAGLIDWRDTPIAHPGIDLAIGMTSTEETFQTFLNAYGDVNDQHTMYSLKQLMDSENGDNFWLYKN